MNRTVGAYLVLSYAYYIKNRSLVSDAEYDLLCKHLHTNFDNIEHHHKSLLCKEALAAGSGFHLHEDEYPQIVINCAHMMMLEKERQPCLI